MLTWNEGHGMIQVTWLCTLSAMTYDTCFSVSWNFYIVYVRLEYYIILFVYTTGVYQADIILLSSNLFKFKIYWRHFHSSHVKTCSYEDTKVILTGLHDYWHIFWYIANWYGHMACQTYAEKWEIRGCLIKRFVLTISRH